MKKITQTVVLLLFVTSLCAQFPTNTINPIIGDESYLAFFGTLPGQDTDEQLRIKAHLFYTELKLRAQTPEGLTEQQKQNRAMVLDHLRDYWTNGLFPSNFDYPLERRPCFIDKNGTICAVGYLVEKTAGLEAAQQINEKHQYDYLMDMNEPALAAWAEEYGFTLEECATIQPTYGPVVPDESYNVPIKNGYGISSGLVGGFNIAVNTVNLSGRFGNAKSIAWLGIITGTSQLVMGFANIKSNSKRYIQNGGDATPVYRAQNTLSYINIAMGTTTIVTSALNLYMNKKLKSKKNAVGLYSYPGVNNEMNLGLSFARRL